MVRPAARQPRLPRRQALLFAGGEPVNDLASLSLEPDLVVCADRGLVHCIAAGFKPDRLVGDFDSVPASVLASAAFRNVQRVTYPSDKCASDLELALESLLGEAFDEAVLVGVSGGRTDHLLFNWMLPLRREWPFALRCIDDSVDARVVTHARPASIRIEPGTTVSLLALAGATGVTTDGLAYALDGVALEPGSTLGLSNVADADEIRVRVTTGTLLLLRVR